MSILFTSFVNVPHNSLASAAEVGNLGPLGVVKLQIPFGLWQLCLWLLQCCMGFVVPPQLDCRGLLLLPCYIICRCQAVAKGTNGKRATESGTLFPFPVLGQWVLQQNNSPFFYVKFHLYKIYVSYQRIKTWEYRLSAKQQLMNTEQGMVYFLHLPLITHWYLHHAPPHPP